MISNQNCPRARKKPGARIGPVSSGPTWLVSTAGKHLHALIFGVGLLYLTLWTDAKKHDVLDGGLYAITANVYPRVRCHCSRIYPK